MIEKAKKIKFIVFDIDGTLTDASINISHSGEVLKSFNAKDGLGINLIQKLGVKAAIMTGRKSAIVLERAKELGIENVYQNIHNKAEILTEVCKKMNISLSETAFMGDDLNDFEVMQIVGFAAAPFDAAEEIKSIAHFVASKKGGKGAAREVVEYILKAQNRWDEALAVFSSERRVEQ